MQKKKGNFKRRKGFANAAVAIAFLAIDSKKLQVILKSNIPYPIHHGETKIPMGGTEGRG